MFHITTNKTEESWARSDIKNAKPSEDSNEILERINKLSTEGMSYEAAIDFFKTQLGTWRRFYKEDDKVEVDEAWTADNKRVTQIKSLNIVFYVREVDARTIKIRSGFYDTIKTSCKKLFEDDKSQFEILEGAK
ncbi:hypothetical protein [Treponema sp. UBA3813]|uniref:hypothetical protein n=1 Tax=Treponema sp. UBA3813 TaxID=1947715 RepID=UPI0025F4C22E|nr:hypothetical protein [Treponema sp. UBA3813]